MSLQDDRHLAHDDVADVGRFERRKDIAVSAALPEVHAALQAAMGWTDSHLHQFVTDEHACGVPMEDAWGDGEVDESGVRLAELPSRFRYLYDVSDDWQHAVEVLGVGCDQLGCVAGEGDCPPEDVGGPPGYEHLLQVLADPGHEEYDDLTTWAGILPLVARRSMNGQLLTVEGLRRYLYQQAGYLRGLDLIVDRGDGWAAGPSAVTLLPRATHLPAFWRR